MDENTVKGRIHSFQSLGAVDGPGIRYVVFTQGCPYRCPYCHNPDTRAFSGGTEYTADELVKKIVRYKSYFGSEGGVTVSGGEPLMQPEFLTELFKKLHAEGINTAIDTAGAFPDDRILSLLDHTDIVLLDVKFPTEEQYSEHINGKLGNVKLLLEACGKKGVRVIVRHVVVPGMTDGEENVLAVKKIVYDILTPEKIELLPFKKLCIEKYKKLGIPFPLESVPECPPETITKLKALL